MVPSHGFSPRSYFFDNPRRYDSDDDLAWNAAPQGLQGRYAPVPTGPGQWGEGAPVSRAGPRAPTADRGSRGARLEGGRHPVCVRGPPRPRRGASQEGGVGLLPAAAPGALGVQAAGVPRPLRPPAGTSATAPQRSRPLSAWLEASGRGGSSWLTMSQVLSSACPRALCHPWEGRCRAHAS